ncbi:unnamed protein product [Bemisia tabaci]|uniref:AAA-ATPase-like domain-containing protein n=1 Tax=Bemisia tabaci TaxID=7038 RepID=A0A9P0AMY4_BEMTA|nr:unnamed protein product [Bemisia tabaci]
MYLFSVFVMVLFIAIHSGSSVGDSPFVENYNSTQLLLRKPINLQTPSIPQASELGYKCAELPAESDRFKTVIKKKCFVDKTDYLYNMVKKNETQVLWFLARPRRFGKTLLIDTIESFFKGETEFFVDTNIYKQHMKYNRWPNYPVIRLDFSLIKANSFSNFKKAMLALLEDEAKVHDIHLDTDVVTIAIRRLILRLKRKYNKKVVVLIDEYDAPYTHVYSVNKSESSLVLANLQEFFSVLKGRVDDIRFSFTTGLSCLAWADFFSGAYAARDISMNPSYAGIVGFNDTELTQYFERFIENVADRKGNTTKEILTEMRKWCDGFRFTRKNEPLYSPISVIGYLRSDGVSINSYSDTGGSSKFLDQKLRQFPYEAIEILLNYDTKDNADQSNDKIEDYSDELEENPEICATEDELSGRNNFEDTSDTALPLVEGMRVVSVHVNLSEHVEGNAVLLRELEDLRVGARLLAQELVRREGEDPEALGLGVFVVELLELLVVGLGEPALAGHVHDDADVVLVLGEVDFVPADVLGGEVIDGSRLLPVVILVETKNAGEAHEG